MSADEVRELRRRQEVLEMRVDSVDSVGLPALRAIAAAVGRRGRPVPQVTRERPTSPSDSVGYA